MHDIKDMRLRPERYRENQLARGLNSDIVTQILDVDIQRREAETEVQNLRAIKKLESEIYYLDAQIRSNTLRIAQLEEQLCEMVGQ
jgi:seryl-tRNA synthetase